MSFGMSSSNLSSYDEDNEMDEKPRKRSLTTRSSKDIFSRNNSDVMEVKKEKND
jgi:hypothetical protein